MLKKCKITVETQWTGSRSDQAANIPEFFCWEGHVLHNRGLWHTNNHGNLLTGEDRQKLNVAVLHARDSSGKMH